MHFTTAAVAAVLAFSSTTSAVAVPGGTGTAVGTGNMVTRTRTTVTYKPTATYSRSKTLSPPVATSPPSAGGNKGLSLTQQLFLADTRVDFFNLLPKNEDFVFDFAAKKVANPPGKGGQIVAANRKTFPALVGTGSGAAVGFLGPCGFNTPHVHPRGTELQFVTKGQLVTEMVPENGVVTKDNKRRVITNTVKTNQMTPFYQGSVHTQFNPDCTDAEFVAFFPTEDFGTGQAADELLAFSNPVVAAVFGQAVQGKDIDKFRQFISPNVAKGVEQCLAKCNIKKA